MFSKPRLGVGACGTSFVQVEYSTTANIYEELLMTKHYDDTECGSFAHLILTTTLCHCHEPHFVDTEMETQRTQVSCLTNKLTIK